MVTATAAGDADHNYPWPDQEHIAGWKPLSDEEVAELPARLEAAVEQARASLQKTLDETLPPNSGVQA